MEDLYKKSMCHYYVAARFTKTDTLDWDCSAFDPNIRRSSNNLGVRESKQGHQIIGTYMMTDSQPH